jgi:DNA-binding PucR family transcriptional regulator
MAKKFTVECALKRPHFYSAVVVAGHEGLHRQIRWVHILEISQHEPFINGGELVLSTGVGLQGDAQLQRTYLHQLIDLGASGLCIELGRYLQEIPVEMKEIANSANFPLIAFQKTVRFIDITEDIHSILFKQREALEESIIEEKQFYLKHAWLQDLIENKLQNEEQLRMELGYKHTTKEKLSLAICLIEFDNQVKIHHRKDLSIEVAISIRSFFRKSGIQPFILPRDNQLVLLLISLTPTIEKDIALVIQKFQQDWFATLQTTIGVGRSYNQLIEAHQSYNEAKQVLQIKQTLPHLSSFYKELGIYRMILQLPDNKLTHSFIDDQLKKVIDYDREHDTKLLHTLDTYLKNIDSRKQAAEHLFIHRQTFYQRLDKLKALLGDDFMHADRRVSLEFALLYMIT